MLTRSQWIILDHLADQDEPLESVYFAFSEGDKSIDPAKLLPVLFDLYQLGFVIFQQEPIKPLGQGFNSRPIYPSVPAEIVGDLAESFLEFRTKRGYLAYYKLCDKADADPGGVPFGIWIEMTPSGRVEWDRTEYIVYWEKGKV